MASNVSREKLLFYAAAGGLGGFAAWGSAEPFLGIHFVYGRDIILGALVGAFIGAFLASIEALSVSQTRLALRGIRSGGLIGAIGGAVGLLVAELAFDFFGGLNGRILGWGILGLAVGFGVGAATGS
ncbi:MAG TPA: hypothetical protein VLL57_09445, partial [Candidatus Binataceae bacterium]|nr:hypothetical protein [Candidatus Binataceae bacterium]